MKSGHLLVALALLLVTAFAFADAPPHQAWTRAALNRVPASKADRQPDRAELRSQNLDVFAREIARVSEHAPLPPHQWASALGAIA